MLMAVIASLVAMIAVFIYAAVDAGLLASRIDGDYRLKEYNRWFIYLIFIVVALAYPTNLSFSLRDNVLQAFKIPSASMMSGIFPGDRIFLNKAIYEIDAPQRGDAVVFVYPDDRRKYFIKRIVALPGDTVEIRDNVVWINGKALQYSEANAQPAFTFKLDPGSRALMETNAGKSYPVIVATDSPLDMALIRVPHGHCFVLGDNRGQSRDSRFFGPVPLADVKGRVNYIYWPALSWSRFGKYEY